MGLLVPLGVQAARERRMFSVFRAHAAPRVALMFTSGPAHGEGIGRLEADPSLPRKSRRAEYRQLLDGHDFDVIATVAEDRTCGRSRIWLAQRR